jgi:hypothetical protein
MPTGKRTRLAKSNSRAFPRWTTQFAVCVITGKKTIPAEPVEMSEGGLSFLTDETLSVGDEITVEFKPAGASDWMRVKCLVRHSGKERRVGVEYLNLRRADRLKIIDLLAAKAQ